MGGGGGGRVFNPVVDPVPGDFPETFGNGGIVTRPMLATIGDKGPEAVIPLSKLAGMLGSKTVNLFIEMDGRLLAQVIGAPLVDNIRLRTGVKM